MAQGEVCWRTAVANNPPSPERSKTPLRSWLFGGRETAVPIVGCRCLFIWGLAAWISAAKR
ncbi:MAG: hypothetical protein IPG51_05655 [Chloroflexi bacterium]|nr:hypothetical protein [Chloroflexota bacterium]